MSMKNSSDIIGNRNRDLPTCSAVPQPSARPRAPQLTFIATKFCHSCRCLGSAPLSCNLYEITVHGSSQSLPIHVRKAWCCAQWLWSHIQINCNCESTNISPAPLNNINTKRVAIETRYVCSVLYILCQLPATLTEVFPCFFLSC